MSWDANGRAYLATGKPRVFRYLVWMRVKRLDNGNPVEWGFWTGLTDRTFTVEGAVRTYVGAQGGIRPSPWVYQPGLEVFTHQAAFSVSPELNEVVRNYHFSNAPYEMHVALFDAESMGLVSINRRWQGILSTAKITDAPIGGQSTIQLRAMTKSITGLDLFPGGKSDADQRERASGDGFLKDASMGTAISDPWQAKA